MERMLLINKCLLVRIEIKMIKILRRRVFLDVVEGILCKILVVLNLRIGDRKMDVQRFFSSGRSSFVCECSSIKVENFLSAGRVCY